ncbi:hypothetical protein HYH03_007293 [Edaphochlamys debaryana]|uniref:cGMP-dependent protein kinase n=1 Tax=Edaphochlamys debaryana TaxID=47281 RepID=A0A835Y5H2_9CHLO|nr:hypothetical protein HYH03_007293 [Edaphochlamys debaryana]|eukprot:KAG2494526.1 hypothetical protein HYH03_007293 [Edaphochlamys debaryana]
MLRDDNVVWRAVMPRCRNLTDRDLKPSLRSQPDASPAPGPPVAPEAAPNASTVPSGGPGDAILPAKIAAALAGGASVGGSVGSAASANADHMFVAMPGKLAAARASREATERAAALAAGGRAASIGSGTSGGVTALTFSGLPRRAGSTQHTGGAGDFFEGEPDMLEGEEGEPEAADGPSLTLGMTRGGRALAQSSLPATGAGAGALSGGGSGAGGLGPTPPGAGLHVRPHSHQGGQAHGGADGAVGGSSGAAGHGGVSSQSVTFLVSSGQHSTPTAAMVAAAALAASRGSGSPSVGYGSPPLVPSGGLPPPPGSRGALGGPAMLAAALASPPSSGAGSPLPAAAASPVAAPPAVSTPPPVRVSAMTTATMLAGDGAASGSASGGGGGGRHRGLMLAAPPSPPSTAGGGDGQDLPVAWRDVSTNASTSANTTPHLTGEAYGALQEGPETPGGGGGGAGAGARSVEPDAADAGPWMAALPGERSRSTSSVHAGPASAAAAGGGLGGGLGSAVVKHSRLRASAGRVGSPGPDGSSTGAGTGTATASGSVTAAALGMGLPSIEMEPQHMEHGSFAPSAADLMAGRRQLASSPHGPGPAYRVAPPAPLQRYETDPGMGPLSPSTEAGLSGSTGGPDFLFSPSGTLPGVAGGLGVGGGPATPGVTAAAAAGAGGAAAQSGLGGRSSAGPRPGRRRLEGGGGSTELGTLASVTETGLDPDGLSAASSFTVRQTAWDAEDELLDRARARRAVRTLTAAANGSGAAAAPGALVSPAAAAGPGKAAALAAPRSADAADDVDGDGDVVPALGPGGPYGAVRSGAHPRSYYDPAAAAGGGGGPPPTKPVIRLNHQPGHRRLPNRHASMPAMKRGQQRGGPATGPGVVHGPPSSIIGDGDGASTLGDGDRESGAAAVLGSLAGCFVPEDDVAPDSPGNGTSVPLALMAAGGAGAAGNSGNPSYIVTNSYRRMPSEASPVMSQVSAASSYTTGLTTGGAGMYGLNFVHGAGGAGGGTGSPGSQPLPHRVMPGSAAAAMTGSSGGGGGGGPFGSAAPVRQSSRLGASSSAAVGPAAAGVWAASVLTSGAAIGTGGGTAASGAAGGGGGHDSGGLALLHGSIELHLAAGVAAMSAAAGSGAVGSGAVGSGAATAAAPRVTPAFLSHAGSGNLGGGGGRADACGSPQIVSTAAAAAAAAGSPGVTAAQQAAPVSGAVVSGRLSSNHGVAPGGGPLASPAPVSNLAALHKAVERLMLQDAGLYSKVQASMQGISSLAKETSKLEFVRDASGATVINQYVVVKTLGRGAFGKVKLCLNTLDGQLYAVKMINRAHLLRQLQKPARPLRRRAPPPRNTSDTGLVGLHMHRTQTEGNLSISHTNISTFGNAAQAAMPARASMDDASPMAAIMREIAVMKKVDHPHVVRLHEVIDPPGSSYLMMVMEYCEGGCVMETRQQTGLTPLGEERAREYFRQACLGLDYLHYNSVVHGDLKPENMLVSGAGALKIADFGSSRFMGGDPGDATKTSCTPAFQSPEEIGHMPVDPYAADLWALGCCLFVFVFGRLPFVGSCVVDIYRAILTRPHAYPGDVSASPALRDLINRMLDKNPAARPSLEAIAQHEWVTAGGALPPLPLLAAASSQGAARPAVIMVSHAEQANAIDRSSLVSLIRARLKEKTCAPGEYLFKEGEEAHCVYMIMAGAVELTQHLRRPPGRTGGGHGGGGGGGASGHVGGSTSGTGMGGAAVGVYERASVARGGGGSAGEDADADASFSVDLDESLTLDPTDGEGLFPEGMNIIDGKLHIDRQQAIEMRRRMQGQLLGDNAEYVVEVKGPGSVIGEMGLDESTTTTHRVSARARGPVTVVKLTEENFFKALLAMYGGGGGGSTVSSTLTASSVSAATAPAGGGGGGTAGGGGAASAATGLSAQHLMVMQYLEDSGSFATYQAPVAGGGGGGGAYGTPGRFSLDAASATMSLGRHHPHPHHYAGAGQAPPRAGLTAASTGAPPAPSAAAAKAFVVSAASRLPATGAAAAAASAAAAAFGTVVSTRGHPPRVVNAAAAAASAAAGAFGSVVGGGEGRSGGPHSILGQTLNTIHSINASRGGHATTSEEGIADL